MKVIIALANLITFASASTFAAYSRDYFAGSVENLSKCGCSNISYHGSFHWYHDGQSGKLYNTKNCKDVAVFTLPSDYDAQQDTGFKWDSIKIVC